MRRFPSWIAAILILLAAAPARGADSVRLASGDWPPYTAESLPKEGPLSEIVREAFARGGIDVTFGYFPWRRSLSLADQGEWDGTLGWQWTSERAQEFYFSAPIAETKDVLFHLRDRSLGSGRIDDLRNLRVAATIGYLYGEAFDRAEKAGAIQVDRTTSDEMNFTMLLAGRVDAVVADTYVGDFILRNIVAPADAARVVREQAPVVERRLHLLLTRKDPRNESRIQAFDRGLAEIRANGRYGALANAFGN